MNRLLTPENHAVISLMTETQKAYRHHRNKSGPPAERLPLKPFGDDHSQPASVRFTWESDDDTAQFIVSESPNGTNPICKQTGGTAACVNNLKIGTVYYWRVGNSEIRSFTTEDLPPRMLSVDGITNVRDLGGWKTSDEHSIRQGLLFRGSEMDLRVNITDNGIRTVRDTLGIKTELDLRYPDEVRNRTESALGSDIKYKWISIHAYNELFRFQKEILQIFMLMTDETNYPLYFHCYGGADRTGMLAMLILSVLGVSEEDIRLDYEMTTCSIFGYCSYETAYMAEFLDRLNRFPGGTFGERAIAFLRSCRCTDGMFEKLRTILLNRDTL